MSKRPLIRASCFFSLVVLPWLTHPLAAAEPADRVLYREVLVPKDKIADFVSGYIPKRRRDFGELVRRSQASLLQARQPSFGTISLQATLEDDSLLVGKGKLERSRILDAESSQAAADRRSDSHAMSIDQYSTVFALDGNFSMERARWLSAAVQPTAILGTDGRQSLLVADYDATTLEFEWSLRGQRQSGNLRFQLRMPSALIHRLELKLPRDYLLQVDRGLVTRQEDSTGQTSLWTINSGGHQELEIIIQLGSEDASSLLPTLRQISTYRFTPGGLTLRSLLTFDYSQVRLSNLRISTDPGLTVTRVVSDGQSLRWSRSKDSENESLIVEMPETNTHFSPNATTATIQIDALGPISWRRLFTLPRLRSKDVVWTHESMRLVVEQPLELTDMRTEDCSCSQIQTLSSNQPGEAFDLIIESPAATVDLQLSPRPTKPRAEVGFWLDLADASVQAMAEVQIQADQGELFELALRVANGWIVESVDAMMRSPREPALSVLDRWEQKDGVLNVRLQRAATAQQPVMLTVKLHREAVLLDNPTAVDSLIPFTIPDATDVSQWIVSRAAPTFQTVVDNVVEGVWQRESDLPSWLSEQWVLSESDTLLRVDRLPCGVSLAVRRATAPTQVVTHTELRLSEQSLRQSVTLQIDPLGNQVSRVELAFSQPLPTLRQWLLNGSVEGLAVRETIRDDDTSNADANRYEISFSPARDQPFEVQAELDLGNSREWQVPLVVVRNASGQNGTVGVRGTGGLELHLDRVEGLQPMPIDAIDNDRLDSRDLRAAFRYNDTSAIVPQLTLRREEGVSQSPCWAWRCDLRSYYAKTGRPRHRVDMFIQNEGARFIEIELPANYDLERIQVDGVEVAPVTLPNKRLSVALPTRQPYPCLTIEYVLPSEILHAIEWLTPPLPKLGMPVLQQTWQVWLPPGFEVYEERNSVFGSDSWRARLFGALAPDVSRPSSPSWRVAGLRLFSADGSKRTLVQQFETLLGAPEYATNALARRGSAGTDRVAVRWASQPFASTWAQRLNQIQSTMARTRPEFKLWIDRVELRRLAVLADSSLPNSRRNRARQIGIDRLTQAGLGLLIQDDGIVVTSAAEVRSRADVADLIDGIAVVDDAAWMSSERVQSTEGWSQQLARLLWQPSTDSLENSLQQAGWVSHRRTLSDPQERLKVFHHDTIVAMSAIVFLTAVGLGWWLIRWKHRAVFTAFAIAVFLALVLPQPGASMAVAAAWAFVASAVLRFIAGASTGSRHRSQTASPSTMTVTLQVLILGCLLGSWVVPTRAQTPESESAADGQDAAQQAAPPVASIDRQGASELAAATSVYPVIVPSDGSQNAVGDIVYLPPELYRRLHANQTSTSPPPFLLTSSIYKGAWLRRGVTTPFRLTASYRVVALTTPAIVPLPDFGPEATLDLRSVRVNRQAVDIQINGDGRPTILLRHQGDYRLTLDLLMDVQRQFEQESVRCAIPRIPSATLELSLPRDTRSVEVPTALGRLNADLRRGSLLAELGPAKELVIRTERSDRADDVGGVDQLIRLELTPEEIRLETTFRFNGAPAPLRLKVDPRIRFDSIVGDDSAAVLQWNESESELGLDVGDHEVSPTLRFTVPNAGPVGRFRVPQFHVEDVPVRHKWLAITVAPSLTLAFPEEPELMSLNQFFETWESESTAPDYIVDYQQPLELDVRLSKNQTTWTSETSFFFRDESISCEVDVEIDAGNRFATIQRLKLPPPWKVTTLAAATDGVPRDVRWYADATGNVLLFFLDQVTGMIQLRIDAERTESFSTNAVALPLVTPSTGTHLPRSVRMYCSPNVELEIVGQDGFVPARDETTADDDFPTRDRWVGSWTPSATVGNTPLTPFTVRVERTTPQISGTLQTRLGRDVTGWTVDVEADLTAQAGRIGEVWLDVPAGLVVENKNPDVYIEVRNAPAVDRNLIVAWLRPAAESHRTVTFQMRVPAPEQEGVSLPRITMPGVATVQHHVLLPTRGFVGDDTSNDESTYAWSTAGLSKLDDQTNLASEGYDTYRVDQPHDYRATLQLVEVVDRRPLVHLLHTTLAWNASEQLLGLATFDLRPANQTRCILELPEKSDLVQVLVDDHRTMARAVESSAADAEQGIRRWRIQLGPVPWPQRVQVLYRGSCDVTNNGRVTLPAPSLWQENGEQPFSVAHATWSVYAPPEAGAGRPQGVVLAESGRRENETLLRALGAVVADVQLLVQDSPREDTTTWFGPWARRSRAVLDRLREAELTDDDPEEREINQLEADLRNSISSLGMIDMLDQPQGIDGGLEQQQLWSESIWYAGSPLRCVSNVTENEQPRLTVDYPRFTRQTAHVRYVIASVVAWMALFLAPLWPRRLDTDWFRNHPWIIGITIGIGWWFLLSPPWLGLLMMATVLALWTYGTLRGRRLSLPAQVG